MYKILCVIFPERQKQFLKQSLPLLTLQFNMHCHMGNPFLDDTKICVG